MKKNKIILTLIMCLSFASCDFLDTVPQDFVSPKNYFKNETEAFMSLTSIYNRFTVQAVYGNTYSVLINGTSDLGYYDRSNVPVGVYNNNYSTADKDVLDFWQALYQGISNANFLLENIDRTADLSEAKATMYKGEAKFLRAYAYFLLAQCYGDVPYKTTVQESVQKVDIKNTPQKEVLLNVVQEMEEAVAMVGEIDELPAGRVSKSAVRGILARVCLKLAGEPTNMGQPMYEKALFWAKEVNKDGKHQLNPNYSEVFINYVTDVADTKYRESIWEAEFKGNRQDGHYASGRIGNTMGIQNGDISKTSKGYSYGFISCTLNLWDKYNDLNGDGQIDDEFTEGSDLEIHHPDARRDWNIAPYTFTRNSEKKYWDFKGQPNASGKKATATDYVQRNVGKYRREYELLSPRDKNNTPINFPILRYSDVLLMIAEAANEVNQAPTQEACDAINAVRARSIDGVQPITTATSYETFKQLVKDERARELCFEATRKNDLVRWGDYLTGMKQVVNYVMNDPRWANNKQFAATYARNASERFMWLPIPNRELGLNSLLTQNKAWR